MATLIGWTAFGLSCAWIVVNALRNHDTQIGEPEAAPNLVALALFVIGFTGIGAIVLSREPANTVGLLFLFPAILPLRDCLNSAITWADQQGFPTGWAEGLLADSWAPAILLEGLVALLLLLIPTGLLPSRRWRPVAMLVVSAIAVSFVQSLFIGLFWESTPPPIPLPLGPPWAPSIDAYWIAFACEFIVRAGVVAGVVSLVHRLVIAQGRERAQVAWVFLGAGTWMLLAGFPGILLREFVPGLRTLQSNFEFFVPIGVLALPVTCGIAILRHDLVELNPLLRRMLSVLVVVMVLTGAYLGLRALLGPGPVAAAVAAIGLALTSPLLYRWLRGAMTWLVYGRRGSPADITARMIRAMATAADPDQVLAVLADAIHQALPGTVEVVLTSAGRALRRASRGGPAATDALRERVPLTFQGNELGWAQVSGAVRLTPMDLALLNDLAGAAAAPLAAAHRSAELQRAHQELITAREQERRRIARDLHDGVGPVLSGLGFALDTLRAKITDPDTDLAARNARGQVREAMQLVRRVTRELRPVGLDQLGLVGSIQELAARYTGPGLTVAVTAEEQEFSELCAATEVAAYAIVAEAVTNVARHAHATRCEVTLQRAPDAVEITVHDNGTGITDAPNGIGRTSMIERARELGGWCRIATVATGGTLVHAYLPQPTHSETAPAASHATQRPRG